MFKEIYNEIKHIDLSPKKLKDFGILFSVIFFLLGAFSAYKHGQIFNGLLLVAVIFIAITFLNARIFKYPYIAWMSLSVILGYFSTKIILAVIFFFVMTPIGLIVRMSKADYLQKTFKPDKSSYWIKYEREQDNNSRFERL